MKVAKLSLADATKALKESFNKLHAMAAKGTEPKALCAAAIEFANAERAARSAKAREEESSVLGAIGIK